MKVTGQSQGAILGGVTQKGKEGMITVNDLTYGLISPRDAASGQATGRRQHQPVQVTVPTGRQTPKLFTAEVNNENLTLVEIDFWLPAAGGGGGQALGFVLKLTNAHVSELDVSFESAGNTGELLDQYSFTFQKIELTWTNPLTVAIDDWSSQPT
jgi:type VI secretion system secreted protein Hcp